MRAQNACLTTHQPAPVLLHHHSSNTANNNPPNTRLKHANNNLPSPILLSANLNSNNSPPLHQPQSPTQTSASVLKMSPPYGNTNSSRTPPRAAAPAAKPPRKAGCCWIQAV